MHREFSAGGVLVRRMHGVWMVAAVRPRGRRPGTWVLPKGRIELGETSEEAALREVAEETGVQGRLEAPIGELRYWYVSSGQRVLKTVSFFVMRYRGGRLGSLAPGSSEEVAEARWLPLAEAPALLAFRGERDMAQRALELIARDHSV